MKKFLLWYANDYNHFKESLRYANDTVVKYIYACIDNSLAMGWSPEDIIFGANIEFEYKGVKSILFETFCEYSLFYNKTYFILEALKRGLIDDLTFYHDFDSWQLIPKSEFAVPDMGLAEIGICSYMVNNQWNAGTIFFKPESIDMFETMVSFMKSEKDQGRVHSSDEPVMNIILRSVPQYLHRHCELNSTYNVGYTGFDLRYKSARKPIHVAHFHPDDDRMWNIFVEGKNNFGAKLVNGVTESILRTHFKREDFNE